METQVISLLSTRPLVTVSEAASTLRLSELEVRGAFAAIANAHGGAYALLGETTVEEEEAAFESVTTKVTMQKLTSSDSEATAYALMALTYPQHVVASAAPVALRPSVADSLHVYPVVSRAALESRPADVTGAAPVLEAPQKTAAVAPVDRAAAPAVKQEPAPSPVAPPQVTTATPPVALSTVAPASPILNAVEAKLPATRTPAEVSVKQEAPQEASVTAAAAPALPTTLDAPRKLTIFDKMKEAAATKRQRDGDDALAKVKKSKSGTAAAAKPKKAPKTENTTSLAKLARASKKKSGAAPASVPSTMSFLDEDDGDAMRCSSNSDDSTSGEAPAVHEETPQLDVIEVSASNDDVILCDDAPPLAFRPAVSLPPTVTISTPSKKDTSARKSGAAASAGAVEVSAAQSTLGSFFNSAVMQFQRSYVREVQTEMKVEDGEYICVDVPCYKNTATGEVISEEEYHRQSAELARAHEATTETPTHKNAGAVVAASPSPAAKSVSRSPSDKAEKAKPSPVTAKTLLSFFKPTA